MAPGRKRMSMAPLRRDRRLVGFGPALFLAVVRSCCSRSHRWGDSRIGLWSSATQELSLGLEPVFKVSTGTLSARQIDLEGEHGDLVVIRGPRRLRPGFVEVMCNGCRVWG